MGHAVMAADSEQMYNNNITKSNWETRHRWNRKRRQKGGEQWGVSRIAGGADLGKQASPHQMNTLRCHSLHTHHCMLQAQ